MSRQHATNLNPELEPPYTLRIAAEYGCSGIWLIEPDAMGPPEYEDLRLPDPLRERFIQWCQMYDSQLRTRVDWDAFNTMGRELAKDLKSLFGPDADVEYRVEPSGPIETIE